MDENENKIPPRIFLKGGKTKLARDMTTAELASTRLNSLLNLYTQLQNIEDDEKLMTVLAQLRTEQRTIILKWHEQKFADRDSSYGRSVSAWMTEHDDIIPPFPYGSDGHVKKANLRTPEEQQAVITRNALTRYLKGKTEVEKSRFLAEFREPQKLVIIEFEKTLGDPYIEGGKAVSKWMATNNNYIPNAQSPLYHYLQRYAATDEEMLTDPRKKSFMEQFTPEQKAIVIDWHEKRDRMAKAGKALSTWMTAHGNVIPYDNDGEDAKSIRRRMTRYGSPDLSTELDERKKAFMRHLTPEQVQVVQRHLQLKNRRANGKQEN